jgi:arylsulfatase
MEKQLPNIILFMSDQHRADCLGIENHPVVMTPNLDHLAAGGVRFDKCYSTCPVCLPARRSLMSGQFPHTHRATANIEGREWDIQNTLPGILKNAGYHTYLVGRDMHLYPERKRFGFDHMVTHYDYYKWLQRKVPDYRYPKDTSQHSGGYLEERMILIAE